MDSKSTSQKSLMTIFAHPDDETFSAGGILGLYDETTCVSVTHDENRITEFQTACKILGSKAIMLQYGNVSVVNKLNIRAELIHLIRKYKPNHIITHINFDYHAEHRMVREIVEEAVEWAGHNTSLDQGSHQIESLWAAETTVLIPSPEVLVDISTSNSNREEAIKVYESQSHKGGVGFYLRFHSTRTRLRGIQAGVEHAEAFLSIPIVRVGSFKEVRVLDRFP